MLQAGVTGELVQVVSEANGVRRGGRIIFSTPSMVLLVERCCHESVAPHLEAGQNTVGSHIDLRHLAPSLEGMEVVARTRLTSVEGRRLTFVAEVFDPVEKVGEATHERFIIDVARYEERLIRKERR